MAASETLSQNDNERLTDSQPNRPVMGAVLPDEFLHTFGTLGLTQSAVS